MFKTTIAFTAALVATTPALASTPLQFQRDGVRFAGHVEDKDGVRHIVGRELESGHDFDLVWRNGVVSGRYNGRNGSFRADSSTQIASR